MHLILLIALSTVTIGQTSAFSSKTNHTPMTTITALTVTKSEGWTSHSTKLRPATREGTLQASAWPPSTTNGTRELVTALTGRTSKDTTSLLSTISAAAAAASTDVTPHPNNTGQAHPQDFGKDDLRGNPGLVAVITIFCIIVALALMVATVQCIQSPRSEFERLEDLRMDKMNEESPFARFSK